MARKPGWYDDPEGLPGVYRWWDGATWTVDVTTDAQARPPGGESALAHPTVPSAEATDEAAHPAGAEHHRRRSRTGRVGILGGLVYLVIAASLLTGTAGLVRPLLDLDDVSGDVPEVGVPNLSEIERGPGADGRYDSGGLTYQAIQGRWSRTLLVSNVPMDDLDGEELVVARPKSGPQYANVWLGTVDPALVVDGDLEATAERFADRFAARGYPDDARLDDTGARPLTVDGADTVRLERHYAYRVRGTPITGEELVVIVVDARDTPGVLVASVPDGFAAARAQARRALDSLRVG